MKFSSATSLLALSVPLASAFPNPLRLILPSTYSQPTARRVSVGDAGHRFENTVVNDTNAPNGVSEAVRFAGQLIANGTANDFIRSTVVKFRRDLESESIDLNALVDEYIQAVNGSIPGVDATRLLTRGLESVEQAVQQHDLNELGQELVAGGFKQFGKLTKRQAGLPGIITAPLISAGANLVGGMLRNVDLNALAKTSMDIVKVGVKSANANPLISEAVNMVGNAIQGVDLNNLAKSITGQVSGS